MYFSYIYVLMLSIPCVFTAEKNGTASDLRVIGGAYAQRGQFPYHVSILVDGNFRCGGSLISKLFVLSAAHCFFDDLGTFDSYDMKILIGHTSIYEWRSPPKIVTGVSKVYTPRTYGRSGWGYNKDDIAVLKLSETLDVPDTWILSLPHDASYAGRLAVATGHGLNWKEVSNPYDRDSEQVGGQDGHLRFTDMSVMRNDECAEAWNGRPMPSTLVCARTGYHYPGSLCDGDSGGSLVCDRAVVGVLSFGSKSCQSELPAVFTRVSSYRKFILNAVNDLDDPRIDSFDLAYYNYRID